MRKKGWTAEWGKETSHHFALAHFCRHCLDSFCDALVVFSDIALTLVPKTCLKEVISVSKSRGTPAATHRCFIWQRTNSQSSSFVEKLQTFLWCSFVWICHHICHRPSNGGSLDTDATSRSLPRPHGESPLLGDRKISTWQGTSILLYNSYKYAQIKDCHKSQIMEIFGSETGSTNKRREFQVALELWSQKVQILEKNKCSANNNVSEINRPKRNLHS